MRQLNGQEEDNSGRNSLDSSEYGEPSRKNRNDKKMQLYSLKQMFI